MNKTVRSIEKKYEVPKEIAKIIMEKEEEWEKLGSKEIIELQEKAINSIKEAEALFSFIKKKMENNGAR